MAERTQEEEWQLEKLIRMQDVVTMIANDAQHDALWLDQTAFNGRTVGTHFGQLYASVQALANVCNELIARQRAELEK